MSRFVSKPHIVLYFLFLLLLTTSCRPKLDEKITAYQEAHNSGDVEKEMSFFAEDIKYDVIGQWKVTDKEDLKKLAETDVVLNSHLIFTDIKSSKNKVTCKVEEENDLLKICGIDKLYYEFRDFIFVDGLIKEVRTQPTQEGADALRNSYGAFGRWAAENRKEELDELRSASVITKDNVGKWMELMRQWREESEKEKEKEGEKEEQ
ncbi:MAG: hypothetical protein OEW48_16750 [Phycisphaerae bacterium]|nr:hypothetical protein [Phycisphaerae bacterium]